MWSYHISDGDATVAGIDFIRLGYDGDHVSSTNLAKLNAGESPAYSAVNGYLAVTMPSGVASPKFMTVC